MLLQITTIITFCVTFALSSVPYVHLAPHPIPAPVAHSTQFFARDIIHKSVPAVFPHHHHHVPVPAPHFHHLPAPLPHFHAIPQTPVIIPPKFVPIYHGHRHYIPSYRPLGYHPYHHHSYHRHLVSVPRHLHHHSIYHHGK